VTSRGTLRGSLVAVQVALSVVLLAGSALFAQSVMRALRVPLGFDVDHVATASVNLETVGYTAPRASTFYADVIEQVRRQPAVEAAAWSTVMPIVGVSMFTVSIEGAQPGDATFDMSEVGPGYFAATRTTLVDGRPFSIADGPGAEPVAIVNETAARRYWNGRALGRHVRIGDAAWRTIVGVTRDTKAEALVETTPPYLYVPLAQQQDARLDNVHLFARVKGDADQALPLLVNAIRSVDRRVPIYSVMTFEDRVRELTMPFRLGAMLFTGFSLLAVTLAVVGIYGVTTFVAGRRTREIGIRLALGAPRTEVIALVVRQGAQPIAVGLASGIALALALGRTAESLLFQADPRDPVTLAAVSIALGVVALAANYIPARRAARLDPVAALRDE
jgi:predicted permease